MTDHIVTELSLQSNEFILLFVFFLQKDKDPSLGNVTQALFLTSLHDNFQGIFR